MTKIVHGSFRHLTRNSTKVVNRSECVKVDEKLLSQQNDDIWSTHRPAVIASFLDRHNQILNEVDEHRKFFL